MTKKPETDEEMAALRVSGTVTPHNAKIGLYEETKRRLADRVWRHVQHYANAKAEVVEAIIARALDPVTGED